MSCLKPYKKEQDVSSMIMPGLAQFMRLLASVCVGRLVSRLCASVCVCVRLCASARVCVRLSSCLASVCVCSRQGFRMRASARVCVRLLASRVPNACVCSRQGFRMRASVCVCVRLRLYASVSRLCASVHVKGSECVRLRLLASASVCVCVCLRMCASACECLRELAHFMRLLTSVVLSRVCVRLSHVGRLVSRLRLSACECSRLCALVVLSRVNRLVSRLSASACGNWLILCVGRHSKSSKGGGRFLLSSYYPLAVFYNVLMLKYPSHHLIYIFYHPMPIMPLY